MCQFLAQFIDTDASDDDLMGMTPFEVIVYSLNLYLVPISSYK